MPASQPRGCGSVLAAWPPTGSTAYLGRRGRNRAESQPGGLRNFTWSPSVKQRTNVGKNYSHQIGVYVNIKPRLALNNKGRREQRPREVK